MKKPRVALVTTVIDNRAAKGTAYVARKMIEQMAKYKDEFDFTLIHGEKTNDPIYREWPELLMPKSPLPFATQFTKETLFWLKQRLQGKKFDIVHYFNHRIWPSYLLASSKKIVITAHEAGIMLDLHPHGASDRVFQFTNKFLHHRMDKLIAVSEFGKKEIVEYYGIKPGKVAVIYNATEERVASGGHPHSSEQDLRDDIFKKFGIKSPFILSVGRLDPHKNILRLIDAYKKSRENGIEENLVLVGGRHLPEYSRKVEEKISSLELKDHVCIAPFIPDEDLLEVYRAARALVYPSLHEGFGLPILEAMLAGTPAAVSNTTALPEIAGGAALLFDPNDTESISSAIVKIVSDGKLRENLKAKGRVRLNDFSWEKSGAKLAQLYRDILKN